MQGRTALHGGAAILADRARLSYHSLVYSSRHTYEDYPWASLPAGTRVCDIGGGRGHVSMALLDAHAHLRVVVQDLPNVIEDAEKVCLKWWCGI